MLHELQFQQTRYSTLSSNAKATNISVPVHSIASQFDASAALMENVSYLGAGLKGAKLFLWTGSIITAFCEIVLISNNGLSDQPEETLGDLLARLSSGLSHFNRIHWRHPVTPD